MISINNLLFTVSYRSSIGPLENLLLCSTLKNEILAVNTFALLLLKQFCGNTKANNSNLFQDLFTRFGLLQLLTKSAHAHAIQNLLRKAQYSKCFLKALRRIIFLSLNFYRYLTYRYSPYLMISDLWLAQNQFFGSPGNKRSKIFLKNVLQKKQK